MTVDTDFPVTIFIAINNPPADTVGGDTFDRIVAAVAAIGGKAEAVSFDPPRIVFRFQVAADMLVGTTRTLAVVLAQIAERVGNETK